MEIQTQTRSKIIAANAESVEKRKRIQRSTVVEVDRNRDTFDAVVELCKGSLLVSYNKS